MNRQIAALCELNFWKDFIKDKPEVDSFFNDLTGSRKDKWNAIARVFANGEVKFFCDEQNEFEELARNADKTLFRLWKVYHIGGKGLFENFRKIEQIQTSPSDSELSSVYFTEGDYKSLIANKLGIMNISINNYDRIITTDGFYIKRNSSGKWTDFKNKISHNCNAAVIMDRYVLNQKNESRNWKDLLDSLIPENLSINFHLTFLTSKIIDRQETYTYDTLELKRREKEKEIAEYLSKIRPKVTAIVEVFLDKSSNFHDRYLLTNYCFIKIGEGFDMSDSKGKTKNEADVDIVCPFFSSNAVDKERYNDKIAVIKQSINSCGYETTNRLLCSSDML